MRLHADIDAELESEQEAIRELRRITPKATSIGLPEWAIWEIEPLEDPVPGIEPAEEPDLEPADV